jgi:hypothetical protein
MLRYPAIPPRFVQGRLSAQPFGNRSSYVLLHSDLMFFFVSDKAIRIGAEMVERFRRLVASFDCRVFLGGA